MSSQSYVVRHIGPDAAAQAAMLATLGEDSLETLLTRALPSAIGHHHPLDLPPAASETAARARLEVLAARNRPGRSYLGQGYAAALMPAVLRRVVLENPRWYTPYTPYQAEISQGRLEALLLFQTLVCELTGLPVANASLLDEASAAAEAMTMAFDLRQDQQRRCFAVAEDCHPATIAVLQARAWPLGIEVQVAPIDRLLEGDQAPFGLLVCHPATDGRIHDLAGLIAAAHQVQALVAVSADPLALCLMQPPGALGADICLGNIQRFGLPLAAGGPHAAFFACRQELLRRLPGRLVGVSKDRQGRRALRLSLQTREQHIRRERASSNICTAQALMANMAAFYAIYHGGDGLQAIAGRIHHHTRILAEGLRARGVTVADGLFFDTLRVRAPADDPASVLERAASHDIDLRPLAGPWLGITLDETVGPGDLADLWRVLAPERPGPDPASVAATLDPQPQYGPERSGPLLDLPVFRDHRGELAMMRLLCELEQRDFSLADGMIPLGSCTMKSTPAAAMEPITWPLFTDLHPHAPRQRLAGTLALAGQLEDWLASITGMDAVSLQPNAGSQGEYAGLLAVRAWQRSRGQDQRRICLIPASAHGTNPASARLAGLEVVSVACDRHGNIDLEAMRQAAVQHRDDLAVAMITYPSTHGVFEPRIRDLCAVIHEHGGQVYLDGANMNAMVGICAPGAIGADVCHLNLHKTFAMPHGGGGPGVGPVCAKAHLAPFLPPSAATLEGAGICAAPLGSAGLLPITWMYIALMGAEGLRQASAVAILSANYLAHRLQEAYPILYRGVEGRVAHECILDLRPLRRATGITEEDVAKRLMDYGFHAPTVSFPVPGTLMVEPTESEPLASLDRFCDAMLAIRAEIRAIEEGRLDPQDNPLKNAPHSAAVLTADHWPHSYSRDQAARTLPDMADRHRFVPVGRIDNAFGDRNLVCQC